MHTNLQSSAVLPILPLLLLPAPCKTHCSFPAYALPNAQHPLAWRQSAWCLLSPRQRLYCCAGSTQSFPNLQLLVAGGPCAGAAVQLPQIRTQARTSVCCTNHQLQRTRQLRATHRDACSLPAQTWQSACSRSDTRSSLHFAANLAKCIHTGSTSGTAAPACGGRPAALMTRTGCARCRWQPVQLSS